jgi:hypothetical protein
VGFPNQAIDNALPRQNVELNFIADPAAASNSVVVQRFQADVQSRREVRFLRFAMI